MQVVKQQIVRTSGGNTQHFMIIIQLATND